MFEFGSQQKITLLGAGYAIFDGASHDQTPPLEVRQIKGNLLVFYQKVKAPDFWPENLVSPAGSQPTRVR